MGTLSKIADVAQKSITFTCMAASVYILVITGRNYLALREKRLANAAAIERQKEMEGTSTFVNRTIESRGKKKKINNFQFLA